MPRLKCANCGQKKSEFLPCKVCGTRYCADCVHESLDTWYKIVKNYAKQEKPVLHSDSPLYRMKNYPGKTHHLIRGCCLRRIEPYLISLLPLEELPPLLGYPWLYETSREALRRKLEGGTP